MIQGVLRAFLNEGESRRRQMATDQTTEGRADFLVIRQALDDANINDLLAENLPDDVLKLLNSSTVDTIRERAARGEEQAVALSQRIAKLQADEATAKAKAEADAKATADAKRDADNTLAGAAQPGSASPQTPVQSQAVVVDDPEAQLSPTADAQVMRQLFRSPETSSGIAPSSPPVAGASGNGEDELNLASNVLPAASARVPVVSENNNPLNSPLNDSTVRRFEAIFPPTPVRDTTASAGSTVDAALDAVRVVPAYSTSTASSSATGTSASTATDVPTLEGAKSAAEQRRLDEELYRRISELARQSVRGMVGRSEVRPEQSDVLIARLEEMTAQVWNQSHEGQEIYQRFLRMREEANARLRAQQAEAAATARAAEEAARQARQAEEAIAAERQALQAAKEHAEAQALAVARQAAELERARQAQAQAAAQQAAELERVRQAQAAAAAAQQAAEFERVRQAQAAADQQAEAARLAQVHQAQAQAAEQERQRKQALERAESVRAALVKKRLY